MILIIVLVLKGGRIVDLGVLLEVKVYVIEKVYVSRWLSSFCVKDIEVKRYRSIYI